MPIDDFPTLIGNHPRILKIEALIRKVSASHATVLVVGESGTGKELVAHAIHDHSVLAAHPFIPVNCGAIPTELLESEFFGHERGAFTGAVGARAGMFQMANGGTIFLDEVAEMSLMCQVKLLRALQDGEVRPVGADRAIKVNVRIVAATSKDLAQEMKQETFREDLFYRLNVIPIVMPPLRERRSDIPMLIDHFLAKQNAKRPEHAPVQFEKDMIARLAQYDWPGNVRELQNIVERMVVLSEDAVILAESLPSSIRAFVLEKCIPKPAVSEHGFDFNRAVDWYENHLIDDALGRTNGNRQAAALLLGLKRTTLVAKLHRRVVGTTFEPDQKYLL